MSTISETVGKRLRIRRTELGYSQELTSEKAGLHPTYIGQVERGEKNLTIESLEKICNAIEYPMEDLFFRINTFDPQDVTAQKCYDLIIEQPKKEHQNIYKILDAIIKYRHGMR